MNNPRVEVIQERFAPLVFVLAALAVMGISWLTRDGLAVSSKIGKYAGGIIFLLGMAVFTWSVACLQKAFLGEVAPVTERLVTHGPYRWIRHPLYLSMVITLLGIGLTLRSLWGTLAVPVLFLPAVIYRARLEEKALSLKFSSAWDDYVSRTNSFIPFLW